MKEMKLITVKGLFRYLVLYVLKEKPLHGYGIMKRIEELLQFDYIPSPGIVYPTLQLLEDMGYIESEYVGRRKVYRLTSEGERLLNENIDEVEEFIAKAKYFRNLAKEIGLDDLVDILRYLIMNITRVPPEVKKKLRAHIQEIVNTLKSLKK